MLLSMCVCVCVVVLVNVNKQPVQLQLCDTAGQVFTYIPAYYFSSGTDFSCCLFG